jgi:hypothetical protein
LQDPFTLTANVVCGDCNNGWMSRLEDEAKPLLFGMLHGRGRTLHRGGQLALATWALKTVLVGAHSQAGGGRLFPGRLHRHLYVHQQPPEDVRIWMTTYSGNHPAVYDLYGLDLDDRQDPSRGQRDIYGATVTLGPVAFQIYSAEIPELIDIVQGWPWPNVTQIWPYGGSFTWAPSPALDDGALVAFSHTISDTLLRQGRRARSRTSSGKGAVRDPGTSAR